MAVRKKTSGLAVFNLILHELTLINRSLPESRKMGLDERRALISKKIYPQYKKTPKYKIRLWPLRELLYRKLKRVPRKKGCDVLAIPKDEMIGIPYYSLDDKILNIYPKCIYLMAIAGKYGSTKIFNTRDYNYERSGLGAITRALNEESDRAPSSRRRNSSVAPVYNGKPQVLPGKQDDGAPESYYLEMILSVNDRPVAESKNVTRAYKKPKNKKAAEKRARDEKYIKKKIAEVKFRKSNVKNINAGFSKRAREFIKVVVKNKYMSEAQKDNASSQERKKEIRLAKKYLRNKHIIKRDYAIIERLIDRTYKKR